MRRTSGWVWLLMGLLIAFGFSDGLGILLLIAVVTFVAVRAFNDGENNNRSINNTFKSVFRTFETSRYDRSPVKEIEPQLAEYFNQNEMMDLTGNIRLQRQGTNYIDFNHLRVIYFKGENQTIVESMNLFAREYHEEYVSIMKELKKRYGHEDVIDVPFEPTKEKKKEKPKEEQPQPAKTAEPKQEVKKDAAYYIQIIDQLNEDIPDEEISKELTITTSLLDQLNQIQEESGDRSDKLSKLYKYYLPALVNILNQYKAIQRAYADPEYKETHDKLASTVRMINEALKNLIASLTDQNKFNLNVDISTLESLLQRDGLTGDTIEKHEENTGTHHDG